MHNFCQMINLLNSLVDLSSNADSLEEVVYTLRCSKVAFSFRCDVDS